MSEGTERMCLGDMSFVSIFLTSNTCAVPYYIACSAVTAWLWHCFGYNASATVADCTQHASESFCTVLLAAVKGKVRLAVVQGNFFKGACTLCLV